MTLVLFDIDLTLIDPDGSGRAGMERAFRELFGLGEALEAVSFAGRTDRHILRQALQGARLLGDDGTVDGPDGPCPFDDIVPRFVEVYARHLAQVLPMRSGRVLPGAMDVVDGLARMPAVRLGLATGNFRRGAALKLEYFGLAEHLRDGSFGDDHLERAEVVAEAIARLGTPDSQASNVPTAGARAEGRADGPSSARGGRADELRVVVVGDTPYDVAAARANGCVAIGVATGPFSASELRAAGAQHVFRDLADVERVLAAVRSDGR